VLQCVAVCCMETAECDGECDGECDQDSVMESAAVC